MVKTWSKHGQNMVKSHQKSRWPPKVIERQQIQQELVFWPRRFFIFVQCFETKNFCIPAPIPPVPEPLELEETEQRGGEVKPAGCFSHVVIGGLFFGQF